MMEEEMMEVEMMKEKKLGKDCWSLFCLLGFGGLGLGSSGEPGCMYDLSGDDPRLGEISDGGRVAGGRAWFPFVGEGGFCPSLAVLRNWELF